MCYVAMTHALEIKPCDCEEKHYHYICNGCNPTEEEYNHSLELLQLHITNLNTLRATINHQRKSAITQQNK